MLSRRRRHAHSPLPPRPLAPGAEKLLSEDLKSRLTGIICEHRRLWLARNRPAVFSLMFRPDVLDVSDPVSPKEIAASEQRLRVARDLHDRWAGVATRISLYTTYESHPSLRTELLAALRAANRV